MFALGALASYYLVDAGIPRIRATGTCRLVVLRNAVRVVEVHLEVAVVFRALVVLEVV